jgi:hypothetical protein
MSVKSRPTSKSGSSSSARDVRGCTSILWMVTPSRGMFRLTRRGPGFPPGDRSRDIARRWLNESLAGCRRCCSPLHRGADRPWPARCRDRSRRGLHVHPLWSRESTRRRICCRSSRNERRSIWPKATPSAMVVGWKHYRIPSAVEPRSGSVSEAGRPPPRSSPEAGLARNGSPRPHSQSLYL